MYRVAILSDIHGILPALRTVIADIDRWRPDAVIVNGDIINRGPSSEACWQTVAKRQAEDGWLVTRGNHEDYVMGWLDQERVMTPLEEALFQTSRWTLEQLSAASVEAIQGLPAYVELTAPDGSKLLATHATMRHNRDGIMPMMDDKELLERLAPYPAVFVTSHTHRIFQRQVGQTLLVNTGSVGAPLDGDERAGYARLCWDAGHWSAELVRLAYDRIQAKQDFFDKQFLSTGVAAELMFLEWQRSESHWPFWYRLYTQQITDGEITLDEAWEDYQTKIN